MSSRVLRWLFPFVDDLGGYTPALARVDLLAGLTVAVFGVPQVMAYAMLAGLPPADGLYCAAVMSVVAALWGSSAFLNTGPTNSASLLAAAALLPALDRYSPAAAVCALTLLVGVVRVCMGALRLGRLVELVPESVLVGFTAGAGTLIALGQVHHLLGVPASAHAHFVGRLADVLGRAHELDPWTLAIGLGTVAFMAGLSRYSRRFPVGLAAIVLATLVAALVGDVVGIRHVHDVAPVLRGSPMPALPPLDRELFALLLPGAIVVAVIGLVEAVSTAQALALRHGHSVSFDREFVGQGLSHLAAAFFHGFPGSGSFSRSVLIEQCGGRTRFASVFFGLSTVGCLLAVPGWLNAIPVCALSGLLLFIGCQLIDRRRIRHVCYASRADTLALVVTFVVMVFVKVEWGLFAGVIASAVLHLYRTRVLRLSELTPVPDRGGFSETAYGRGVTHERSDLVVVSVAGDLFFGVSHLLREELKRIVEQQQPRVLILRTRRVLSIDYSCWQALLEFAEAFHRRGGSLYLCGVSQDMYQVVAKISLREVIPSDHIFLRTDSIFGALYAALGVAVPRLPADAVLSPRWAMELRRSPPPATP